MDTKNFEIIENENGDKVITKFLDKLNTGKVIIPEGITEIHNHAFKFSKAKSFIFPSTLRTIGTYAFYGCFSLKTINLENVEHLENNAFTYVHLDNIVFDKIKTIDSFSIDASKLNYIWFRCIPERIDENFLSADPDITKIKISKENYTKLPNFLIKQFSGRILITDNSLENLIEEKKTLKEVNVYLSNIEKR